MAELFIYDVIGEDMFGEGVTPKTIRDALQAADGEDLDVRINSPGGDVFDGVAIKTLLDNYEGAIRVRVDGVAASAASLIAMAGQTVEMAQGSMLMIHDPWTVTAGDPAEHRRQADLLDKIADNLVAAYADRSGHDPDTVRDAMRAETWFTGDEAVEFGLADGVAESEAKAWAVPAEFGYHNSPKPQTVLDPGGPKPPSVAAMRRRLTLARKRA